MGDVTALPLGDGSAFGSGGGSINMSKGVRGNVDMMSGGESKRGKGSNGGEGTSEGPGSKGNGSGNKRSSSRNKMKVSRKVIIGFGRNSAIESGVGRQNTGSEDTSR